MANFDLGEKRNRRHSEMRSLTRNALVAAYVLLSFIGAGLSAQPASQPSSPPPENPCQKWTLNGYAIGMSKDAAFAVRQAELKKSTFGLRPGFRKAFVNVDKIRGTLIFDDHGALFQWISRPKVKNYTELRAMITDRLGPPTAERGSSGGDGFIPDDSQEVRWTSVQCGAEMQLSWMEVPISDVVVLTLGKYPQAHLE